MRSILQSMLPLKKTNVDECTERSSNTSSTDYAAVMQTNVPHFYTDSIHKYSIQTFIKNNTIVPVYLIWPSVVSSDIIHLFTES